MLVDLSQEIEGILLDTTLKLGSYLKELEDLRLTLKKFLFNGVKKTMNNQINTNTYKKGNL